MEKINSQKKVTILVTASGSAIAQGIIKSIKNSDLNYRLVTADNNPYAPGLYRGEAGYIVPLAKSEQFIDEIIALCKKEAIDIILIGTDYELLPFANNKERIEKECGTKVVVSNPDAIQIADDKWLTYKFMKDNGFPVIPSALHTDVDALIEEVGFPLIVKPRIGDSSKNIYVVDNKNDLDEKIALLLQLAKDNPFLAHAVDPFVQQYLEDDTQEFTSTTAVFDNTSCGVISMNREMRFGGHTTKAVIKDFKEVNEHIKKVAEVFNPYGPCNFQSRVVDGIPYIFEINCRFSGTTGMCGFVGFNHVQACIKHVLFKEPLKELSYNKGTVLRYFNELFVPEEDTDAIKESGVVKNSSSKRYDAL